MARVNDGHSSGRRVHARRPDGRSFSEVDRIMEIGMQPVVRRLESRTAADFNEFEWPVGEHDDEERTD